jgi:hypothetical protein
MVDERSSEPVRRTSPRASDMRSSAVGMLISDVNASVTRQQQNEFGGIEDDGDDVGELVSDGIVTWRRKLPDIGLVSRASAAAKHQQHHMHRHYQHQQQQQQAYYAASGQTSLSGTMILSSAAVRQQTFAADGRTMSLAVPSHFDYGNDQSSERTLSVRRDAFAQQKSFSCEAATTRTSGRLSASPSPTSRSPVGSVREGSGGRQSSSHGVSGHSHHSDRRRRAMLGSKKKSYSLDDQLAAAQYGIIAGPQYIDDRRPSSAVVSSDCGGGGGGGGGRRQQQQSYGRESAQASSGYDRSSQQQQKKLMMLHTMKAVGHEQYDSTAAAPTAAAADSDVSTSDAMGSGCGQDESDKLAAGAEAAQTPAAASKQRSGGGSRLPIARLWDRLRPDRNRMDSRAVTAGGGRK